MAPDPLPPLEVGVPPGDPGLASPRLVPRVDRVEHVVEALRGEILSGGWAPGSSLPAEGELCATFGVSRTVIREAIRTLRTQGLVEVSQGRRPWIKPAEPQAAVETLLAYLQRGQHTGEHILEVRTTLETEIARLAAVRAEPSQLHAMQTVVREQREGRSLEETVQTELRFHALLAAAAGNPLFELLRAALSGLLRQSQSARVTLAGHQRAAREHQAILTALERRDPEAACQAMREHLRPTAFEGKQEPEAKGKS